MNPDCQTVIEFLYTNIGRGHPHYLDGIVESLSEERVGRVTDVFAVSAGIERAAWKMVRTVYRVGGRGGLFSKAYSRARAASDYNSRGFPLDILGRGLTRNFLDDVCPLVVAHPLLVALLRNRPNLFYQHGEVVAPLESLVRGDHRIIVPFEETADSFMRVGFGKEQIFLSGLCIEPALVSQAEGALSERIARLSGLAPLSGAFFSSGAEPLAHVHSIVGAAVSAVDCGGRALVFARDSGTLQKYARRRFAASGCDLPEATNLSVHEIESARALLCLYDDRLQLNDLTARFFPLFDYFVAPSHERTNWALGLGLPMFVVDPPLGSYAPLNRQILLKNGVARIIRDKKDALHFGEDVGVHQKTGEVQRMAEASWQRFDIGGFAKIAEMLAGS